MASDFPVQQKRLGKTVVGFNGEVWRTQAVEMMREGVMEKICQNRDILKDLKSFGPDTIFAEASAFDRYFGIGFGIEDEGAKDKSKWGANNLGNMYTIVAKFIDIKPDML
jgi:ribA/ribD-fused uncharacterized protein